MDGQITEFIKHHYRHFNAAALVDAAEAYNKHIESGGKMMITLAGAMSTAELGLSLAEMIRQDKVAIISCTGANLEEDLFNLVAHDFYERVPHYRDLTPEDEQALLDRHMNRVTDTCIPEFEAMRRLGAKAVTALVVPTREVAWQILALNTEKAHNLKERALEVIRIYRGLLEEDAGLAESGFSFYLEDPALVTLGICYEKNGRFAGGAYHLVSSRPVIVYQFNPLEYRNDACNCLFGPYSFSNDASLLLPSTAATGSYRVTAMRGQDTEELHAPGYISVTGLRDNTNVRVRLGPRATLVFENRQTLWFRVQDVLRVARLADPDRARAELDLYNRLLPDRDRLQAALVLSIDETRLAEELAPWRDLRGEQLLLHLGGARYPANLLTCRPDSMGSLPFTSPGCRWTCRNSPTGLAWSSRTPHTRLAPRRPMDRSATVRTPT